MFKPVLLLYYYYLLQLFKVKKTYLFIVFKVSYFVLKNYKEFTKNFAHLGLKIFTSSLQRKV